MTENCCSSNKTTMILACSGASNVGQLSNQVAIDLTQEGYGKMFCLAGVGGQIDGFVQSAKDAENLLVLDGCQVGCARAILENNEIQHKDYIVITDLGIEKNKDFNLNASDIETIKTKIKNI